MREGWCCQKLKINLTPTMLFSRNNRLSRYDTRLEKPNIPEFPVNVRVTQREKPERCLAMHYGMPRKCCCFNRSNSEREMKFPSSKTL